MKQENFQQLINAVGFCQRRGVYHRDLKNMEVPRKMGLHTGITSELAIRADSRQSKKGYLFTLQVIIGMLGTINNKWVLAKKLVMLSSTCCLALLNILHRHSLL